MGVSFTILEDLDLVYVRYEGKPSIRELAECFAEYMAHPKCRPGQKQFVDLAEVAEPFPDYTGMMKFMARMADQFRPDGPQTLLACYAPTPVARKLALIGLRSWGGIDHVIYRVFDEMSAAMNFLGIPEHSVSGRLGASDQDSGNRSRAS